MTGSTGNEIFIGGTGNDSTTGTGTDLLIFNRGDVRDTVNASTGADCVSVRQCGHLAGIGLIPAQEALGSTPLGTTAQTPQPLAILRQGVARLG